MKGLLGYNIANMVGSPGSRYPKYGHLPIGAVVGYGCRAAIAIGYGNAHIRVGHDFGSAYGEKRIVVGSGKHRCWSSGVD